MWHVFHFMFYVIILAILDLFRVCKVNLQWSCLPFFANSFSWKEKLKFKYLDGVFKMFQLFLKF